MEGVGHTRKIERRCGRDVDNPRLATFYPVPGLPHRGHLLEFMS